MSLRRGIGQTAGVCSSGHPPPTDVSTCGQPHNAQTHTPRDSGYARHIVTAVAVVIELRLQNVCLQLVRELHKSLKAQWLVAAGSKQVAGQSVLQAVLRIYLHGSRGRRAFGEHRDGLDEFVTIHVA